MTANNAPTEEDLGYGPASNGRGPGAERELRAKIGRERSRRCSIGRCSITGNNSEHSGRPCRRCSLSKTPSEKTSERPLRRGSISRTNSEKVERPLRRGSISRTSSARAERPTRRGSLPKTTSGPSERPMMRERPRLGAKAASMRDVKSSRVRDFEVEAEEELQQHIEKNSSRSISSSSASTDSVSEFSEDVSISFSIPSTSNNTNSESYDNVVKLFVDGEISPAPESPGTQERRRRLDFMKQQHNQESMRSLRSSDDGSASHGRMMKGFNDSVCSLTGDSNDSDDKSGYKPKHLFRVFSSKSSKKKTEKFWSSMSALDLEDNMANIVNDIAKDSTKNKTDDYDKSTKPTKANAASRPERSSPRSVPSKTSSERVSKGRERPGVRRARSGDVATLRPFSHHGVSRNDSERGLLRSQRSSRRIVTRSPMRATTADS